MIVIFDIRLDETYNEYFQIGLREREREVDDISYTYTQICAGAVN